MDQNKILSINIKLFSVYLSYVKIAAASRAALIALAKDCSHSPTMLLIWKTLNSIAK